MVAQIGRLDELDFGKAHRDLIGLRIDALDQHAGEQEIRKDDDAAEAEPRGPAERRVDTRVRDTAIRRLAPAEPHPLPQHARDLADVRIRVRVVGATPDDNEKRVFTLMRDSHCDAVGSRGKQFRVDREIAAELDLDARIGGHKAVHLPGQVVLDVARREQHPRYREDPPRAPGRETAEPLLDRRAREFEIAGREIPRFEAPTQRRGGDFELADRVGIAAAMAAQQDRGVAHSPALRRLLAAAA